jgi:hypothetical protein
MNVPLRLPRSRTHRPLGRGSSSACSRDTVGSFTTRSTPSAVPVTMRPSTTAVWLPEASAQYRWGCWRSTTSS